MTFDEILPAVKAGGRARRKAWEGIRADWQGSWIEVVQPPPLPDGRTLMPLLMVGYPDEGHVLRPFAGANWDLLAGDWELLDAG